MQCTRTTECCSYNRYSLSTHYYYPSQLSSSSLVGIFDGDTNFSSISSQYTRKCKTLTDTITTTTFIISSSTNFSSTIIVRSDKSKSTNSSNTSTSTSLVNKNKPYLSQYSRNNESTKTAVLKVTARGTIIICDCRSDFNQSHGHPHLSRRFIPHQIR